MADRDIVGPSILVLGPVAIAGTEGVKPLRGQQGEILAALAAAHPAMVRTDVIMEALWPDRAPKTARTGLSVVIHRLRERLAAVSVQVIGEGGGYRLEFVDGAIDAAEFRRLVGDAERALSIAGIADTAAATGAADLLLEALDLWRGDAYQPFGHDEPLAGEARNLEQERAAAEELLLEALLAAGRADDAATWGTRFTQAEPYRERRWELLMLALYRTGRQAEALRVASQVGDILRDELGIEPRPSLRTLEHQVLTQDPALDGPSGSSPSVGQFLDALRDVAPDTPGTDTAFIGRDGDVERVAAALDRGRLVTVTGPAGVGKTRLVAQFVRGCPERVVWLDLVDLDADTLVGDLAAKVGVRGGPDLAGRLRSELDREATFLVLDNAEHLASAVGDLARGLTAVCPALNVLVTSRVDLQVAEEETVVLGPLEPDMGRRLLLERAFGADQPPDLDPEAIDALVTQLDASPLHLELMAPLLRTTPASELLTQLQRSLDTVVEQHRPDRRHRTLARAIDWSLELASERAVATFGRLGVLRAEFGLADAVQAVQGERGDVRDDLAELVRLGLVTRGGKTAHQYRLSPSGRTHARALLERDGRLASSEQHLARHYVALVGELRSAIEGSGEERAVARLIAAGPQLRAAKEVLLDAGEYEAAADLVNGLWEFSFLRQQFGQFGWSREVLASAGDVSFESVHDLAATAAMSAWATDDFDEAQRLADLAERHAVAHGRPVPLFAIKARFNVAAQEGRIDDAGPLLVDFMGEAERRGSDRERADGLVVVTLGQIQLGLHDEARRTAEFARRLARDTENPSSIAWATFAQGTSQLVSDPAAAGRALSAAGRLARTVDNEYVYAMASASLVTSLRRQRRHRAAVGLLAPVIDHWTRVRASASLAGAAQEAALLLDDMGHAARSAEALRAVEWFEHAQPASPEDAEQLAEIATRPLPDVDDSGIGADSAAASAHVRGLLAGL